MSVFDIKEVKYVGQCIAHLSGKYHGCFHVFLVLFFSCKIIQVQYISLCLMQVHSFESHPRLKRARSLNVADTNSMGRNSILVSLLIFSIAKL